MWLFPSRSFDSLTTMLRSPNIFRDCQQCLVKWLWWTALRKIGNKLKSIINHHLINDCVWSATNNMLHVRQQPPLTYEQHIFHRLIIILSFKYTAAASSPAISGETSRWNGGKKWEIRLLFSVIARNWNIFRFAGPSSAPTPGPLSSFKVCWFNQKETEKSRRRNAKQWNQEEEEGKKQPKSKNQFRKSENISHLNYKYFGSFSIRRIWQWGKYGCQNIFGRKYT